MGQLYDDDEPACLSGDADRSVLVPEQNVAATRRATDGTIGAPKRAIVRRSLTGRAQDRYEHSGSVVETRRPIAEGTLVQAEPHHVHGIGEQANGGQQHEEHLVQ